jgi:thiol-disulfide isomerase/thioredoxin
MGQLAPDVTMTLFDGSTMRLSELRGSVVVLNFWASWCAPCREEMPALEAVSAAPPAVGVPVAFIGLAVKSDTEDDARAFAQEIGVTYPTGRDGGTDNSPTGPIQRAFAFGDFIPTTVFIAPDGPIAMVHLGQLDEETIQAYIEQAATAPVRTPAV